MKDESEYIPHWDCASVYQVGDKVVWTDGTVKECAGSSWVNPKEYQIKETSDAK